MATPATSPDQPYKLCVARPTGWQLESPDIATWCMRFTHTLLNYPEIQNPFFVNVSNARISMMRNQLVTIALRDGATHLLFLDPDMSPDRYVKRDGSGRFVNRFRPFFNEAWPFMKAHPGSIVAAPYCGRPPHSPCHVFSGSESGRMARITREQAATLTGWQEIMAIGTGLMLIDMDVFRKLKQPWFDDVYSDESNTKLHWSQDVRFCLRARQEAGASLYCNFDCWAGHWQLSVVEWPGMEQEPFEETNHSGSRTDPSVPVLSVPGRGDKSWG